MRNSDRPKRADALFSAGDGDLHAIETYHNYATFLLAQGRKAEAHEWAHRILAKKPTMPSYLRRARASVVPRGQVDPEAVALAKLRLKPPRCAKGDVAPLR